MLIRLHEAIAAVAPINSVSGAEGEVVIDFNNASQEQIEAANQILEGFDWSQQAHDDWLESMKPNRKALRDMANSAIEEIDVYLAIPAPTAVQVRLAVGQLALNQKQIIQRLIQID